MNIHSLKIKFIFICLVLLAGIILFQYIYFIPKMRADEIKDRMSILINLSQQLSSSIEDDFQKSKNAIEEISRDSDIIALQPEHMDQVLARFNAINQFFNYFFVVNPEGEWLSYPSSSGQVGKKVTNLDWVNDVLKDNKTIFLDAHLARAVESIVSGYATPISGESGNIKAILRGVINLTDSNALLNRVKKSKFGENGFFYLTDSKGKLLAHPNIQIRPENFTDIDYSTHEPVRLALQGDSGVTEYELNNKIWLASYRPILSTGWILIGQQPKDEILIPVNEEIKRFSTVLLFSFISVVIILVFVTHRALTPLSCLLDNIRSGVYRKEERHSKDEISQLANEFERLYASLLEANQLLEEEIVTRSAIEKELIHSKNMADQANAAKTEFLANMSHELRTPLNGILGFAEILFSIELPDKPKGYVSMINQSADRLLRLVNDILDFSKINAAKLKLEEIDFNLRKNIDSSLEILKESALAKGLDFKWSIDENIPSILIGDPIRLIQILVNLTSNAIKFTQNGEVEILVTLQDRKDDQVVVLFSVRDTGIGVPANKKKTIFDSFTQADFSHSRKYGGTGLGLAISKELTEMMGGEIWFESNSGSTFFFTARFAYKESQPIHSEEPPISIPSQSFPKKLNILLAEDDEINRLLATTILEDKGWQVKAVVNGQEALDAWRWGGFDIILMDIQMPEMDGHQSTTAIRQEEGPTGQRIPIIALTAHALVGDSEKYLQAGMDAYLTKPMSHAELCATIINLTQKKE